MRTVMTGLALMVSASTAVTAEPTKFQATLAGHAVLNATQIIVANDNNFPFSAGREPQKQDDNEFILLDVAEFLRAR